MVIIRHSELKQNKTPRKTLTCLKLYTENNLKRSAAFYYIWIVNQENKIKPAVNKQKFLK